MTIPELINDVLRRIRTLERYHNRDREFMRDQRPLQRAIARYGYACHARGWSLDPAAIHADLVALLRQLVEQNGEIKYFPIYLEYAVDRHVRTRADELSAQAKANRSVPRLAATAVAGLPVVRVIEPTAVELLDRLYRDLKSRRPKKIKAAVKAKQEELL